jgi:hypothetical protein
LVSTTALFALFARRFRFLHVSSEKFKTRAICSGCCQGPKSHKSLPRGRILQVERWPKRRSLEQDEQISKRIEELKTTIAEQVVRLEVAKRSARIRILQDRVDRMLELSNYRAAMYANHLGEDRTSQVANSEEEAKTRAEGFGDPPIDVFLELKWKGQFIRNQRRDQAAQKIYDQGRRRARIHRSRLHLATPATGGKPERRDPQALLAVSAPLSTNERILDRTDELKTTIADGVVMAKFRRPSRLDLEPQNASAIAQVSLCESGTCGLKALLKPGVNGPARRSGDGPRQKLSLGRAEGFGDPPVDVFLDRKWKGQFIRLKPNRQTIKSRRVSQAAASSGLPLWWRHRPAGERLHLARSGPFIRCTPGSTVQTDAGRAMRD